MKSITPFKEARYLVKTPYSEYFCDTMDEAVKTRENLIKGGHSKVSWRSLTAEEISTLQEI